MNVTTDLATINTTVGQSDDFCRVDATCLKDASGSSDTCHLPKAIVDLFDRTLPVGPDVHGGTRKSNIKKRALITLRIESAIRNQHRVCTMRYKLTESMFNGTFARDVSKWIEAHWKMAWPHKAGVRSRGYQIPIDGFEQTLGGQNESPKSSPHKDGTAFSSCVSDIDGGLPARSASDAVRRRWMVVDKQNVDFWPGWRSDLYSNWRQSISKLHPDYFDFELNVKFGFDHLAFDDLDDDQIRELAKRHSRTGTQASFDYWVRSYRSICKGLRYTFRRSGRLYTDFCSLPSYLRLNHTRFGSTPGAECDINASYWHFVAGEIRPCRDRDRLVDLLQSGQFYEAILAEAGIPYAKGMRHLLKRDVNRECLFDHHSKFGSGELFGALHQMLPAVGDWLLAQRRGEFSATTLSHLLMRRESDVIVDTLLPLLTASGIPAMTVHDSVMVPGSEVDHVQMLLSQIMGDELGFRPSLKIKRASPT